MRTPLVIGNWKMNGSSRSSTALAEAVASGWGAFQGVECGVCPPFVHLAGIGAVLGGTELRLGAQDVSEFLPGAYTGETAAEMLLDLGLRFVIIGHSERRALFGDTDLRILAKLRRAQSVGLVPILCVGETLEERRAGVTEAVVSRQLDAVLTGPDAHSILANLVVAYEPVWAIGTGETATPAQAQAVHAYIRNRLAGCDPQAAQATRLLYGGSVKPGNAPELFAMPDIDGGLVGGAALQAGDFIAICAAAQARVAAS